MKQKKNISKSQEKESSILDKNELDVWDLMRLCLKDKESIDYILSDPDNDAFSKMNEFEKMEFLKEIGIDYNSLED